MIIYNIKNSMIEKTKKCINGKCYGILAASNDYYLNINLLHINFNSNQNESAWIEKIFIKF